MKKKHLKYRAGIATFFSALIVVGLLNMVAPKPTYSDRENRELAKMPQFTFAALADGSYLSGFQTYFSDTFLGRDWLFDLAATVKSWYGIIGEEDEIIIENNPNNSVDEGIAQDPSSAPSSKEETPSSQEPGSSVPPTSSTPPVSSETPSSQVSSTPEPEREEEGQSVNGLVVGTQTVFQLYHYSEKVNNRYAAAVSAFAEKYPNIATHCMVVPINTAFYLPEKYISKTSDERASIEKIYAAMSDKVHTVDAYSKLEQHASEYIYFRTDHHWTQLGAYYGYSAFTESLGNTPFDLSTWRKVNVGVEGNYEFLGSLYSKVRENAAAAKRLEANADIVEAYMPNFEYKLLYYPAESITKPASYHGKGTLISEKYKGKNRYLCFIHGDQPMEVIENYDNPNGKTLMIFKESYGNAFVPLVCNDFERVIVIDPRYFKQSLSELMTLYDVTDALFLNYILAPGTSQRVNEIEKIVKS